MGNFTVPFYGVYEKKLERNYQEIGGNAADFFITTASSRT
jgi:hypothetical protein